MAVLRWTESAYAGLRQALRGRQDAGGVAAGGGVAGSVQLCRAGPCGAIVCCVELWDLARVTPSIGYTA